jgi:hypothetical protein
MTFGSAPAGATDVFYCYWMPPADKWFGIFWNRATAILEIPEPARLFPKIWRFSRIAVGSLYTRVSARP